MTLFNLLEEIKIIKDQQKSKLEKDSNKSRKILKSISKKVNEKLKEIYHPDFLKKIYKRLQHVYVFDHEHDSLSRGIAYSYYSDDLVLKILKKKGLLEETKNYISLLEKYKEKYPNVPYKLNKNYISSKKNGKYHSYGDAPAVIRIINNKRFIEYWYKNGKKHRENDKPAEIWPDERIKKWYKEGKIHRENDKPAVISTDKKEWWYKGKIHRENNKPAIVFIATGKEYYYYHGEKYNPKEIDIKTLKKRKKQNENKLKRKEQEKDLQKRSKVGRTFSLNFKEIKNKNELIYVIMHELQHLFEDNIYNLKEFTTLKRKIIVFIQSFVDITSFSEIKNEIVTEVGELLTSLNNLISNVAPSYEIWETIKNQIHEDKTEKEFIVGLKKILKESKIYNPNFISKIIKWLSK